MYNHRNTNGSQCYFCIAHVSNWPHHTVLSWMSFKHIALWPQSSYWNVQTIWLLLHHLWYFLLSCMFLHVTLAPLFLAFFIFMISLQSFQYNTYLSSTCAPMQGQTYTRSPLWCPAVAHTFPLSWLEPDCLYHPLCTDSDFNWIDLHNQSSRSLWQQSSLLEYSYHMTVQVLIFDI